MKVKKVERRWQLKKATIYLVLCPLIRNFVSGKITFNQKPLMKMKVYVQPTMMVVELQHGTNILQYSRTGYGSGGSGYDDPGVGGRTGYGDGGDGFSGSSVGGRSGYGPGAGWDDSSVGSRSGYGMGGDGWD